MDYPLDFVRSLIFICFIVHVARTATCLDSCYNQTAFLLTIVSKIYVLRFVLVYMNSLLPVSLASLLCKKWSFLSGEVIMVV